MNPGTQIILSGTLTFGVPLVLAVRDLITLRRPSGGSWRPEPPEPAAPRPSGGGGHTRPVLPECLIIAARGQPQNAPSKHLELV